MGDNKKAIVETSWNEPKVETQWTEPSLEKKNLGSDTPTESSQDIPVVSESDLSPASEQPTPLGKKSGVSEPIDLPSSYQNNRTNYKDLVAGQKYKLLRGGKPITGTWNAERGEFIKDPLINVAPQEKKAEGVLEKAFRVSPQTTSGIPLPTATEIKAKSAVESQEEALSRASIDADLVKKEVGDKMVAIEALSTLPNVQQYAELQKQFESTTDAKQKAILQKKLDELGVESPFKKGVTRIGTGEEVVYNGDLYAPKTAKLEEFTGKLVEPTSTTAEVYNRIKEDSDYVQQAAGELKSYNTLVNNMLLARLPEDKRQYLKTLEGTPLYEEELTKTLAQDKEISNIIPAIFHGLSTKIEGLTEAGATLGLDDYETKYHSIANARKKEMFGKVPVTAGAKIAEGVAGMAPDLLFGAYWSPLMLASMGTTMSGDFMEQNIYEQYQSGIPIDDIDLSKARAYSAASTASQMALMTGAGMIAKAAPIVGKTLGKRATKLLLNVGKEGLKGAAIFGVLGTEVQNQINKAYDMAADDQYLEHAITMGAISSLFALKHGLGQTIKMSKAKSNEIDNLTSYLPPQYTKGIIDNLVKEGKMSATNGEEVLTKMNEYRTIRNQIPVEIDAEQMDRIHSIWQEKQKIQNLSKDASPEFKVVLRGQEKDLDQKILIEARVPLSGEERAERKALMQKQAEANPVDEARLKFLNKRWEAEKEGKEVAKKEEEAKVEAQRIAEPKTETDAIQERSTEEILSREREGISQEGGERSGVGQGDKGEKVAEEGKAPKVTEQEITIFKGQMGKLNADGTRRSAHPNAEGFFASESEETAKRYSGEDKPQKVVLPKGVTVEEVEVADKNKPMSEIRREEERLINESKAQIVKLKTIDAQGEEVQYIVKDKSLLGEKPVESKAEEKVEPTQAEQVFTDLLSKKRGLAERDKILEEGFGEQAEKAKFVFKNFKNIIRDMEKKGLLKLEGDCF